MPYVPNNNEVYTLAYNGVMAGITVANRVLTDSNSSAYDDEAAIAGAFAEAVDTAFNNEGLSANELTLGLLSESCEGAWTNRAPLPTPDNLSAASYTDLVAALIAVVKAAVAYFAAEGITPPGGMSGLPTAYQSAFAAGTFSTSGGPLVVASLTTPALPAGTYRIAFSAAAGSPTAVAKVDLFNLTDAVILPPTPVDSIDNAPPLRGTAGAFAEVVFAADDVKTFQVRLTKGGGGGGSVSIHDPRMEFWQVS